MTSSNTSPHPNTQTFIKEVDRPIKNILQETYTFRIHNFICKIPTLVFSSWQFTASYHCRCHEHVAVSVVSHRHILQTVATGIVPEATAQIPQQILWIFTGKSHKEKHLQRYLARNAAGASSSCRYPGISQADAKTPPVTQGSASATCPTVARIFGSREQLWWSNYFSRELTCINTMEIGERWILMQWRTSTGNDTCELAAGVWGAAGS